MSLLEEILSGIKRESSSADVPPNLRRIVSSSMIKQKTRKRTILISIFALVMVAVGYGAILFFETVPNRILKPDESGKVLRALQGLKNEPFQTQSIQPAAADSPPQSPSLPITDIIKPAIPEREPSTVRQLAKDEGRPLLPLETQSKLSRNTGFSSQEPDRSEKDLHLYTARSFEGKGDLGKALAEYRKALELDGENHLILNNMAGVLIRLGLYRDAIAYAERSLAARKDHVPSLINLGVAKLKSGETEEGKKSLAIALELSPTDRAALSNLALLYERAGEYRQSYDLFQRLAAMDDLDGHLGMARVCEKENRPKEAEAIYRAILKRELDKRTKKVASERLAALGSASDRIR